MATATCTDIRETSVGDTSPPFSGVMEDALDQPIDLTGSTVVFRMRASDGTYVHDSAVGVTIAVGTSGRVSYQPVAGDVDEAGSFRCTWRITFPSGRIETVPNGRRYILWVIA